MDSHVPETEWTPGLVIFGFVICVGVAIPAGLQVSVINAPAEFIRKWCHAVVQSRFGVSLSQDEMDILWASVVTMAVLTGMVGGLSGGIISAKLGRKKSFLICSVLLFISAPCFLFCRPWSSIELLFVGRAVAGLAVGLCISVMPMYLTEVSPIGLRGTMGVLLPVGVTIGVVIGQVVTLEQLLGSEDLWHYGLSCFGLFNIFGFVFYLWIPESPEYLSKIKNDPEGAARALEKLYGRKFVNKPVEETNEMSIEQSSLSLWSVLKDKKLHLPLVLLSAMTFGCGFSGINAIFSYSVSTLERIGLNPNDAKFVSVGYGCLNLVASGCGPFLMARFDIRPLMLISCTACGTTLLLITMTIHFIDSVDWFAMAAVFGTLLFLISYQTGIGQISFFIGSELFEMSSRSSAQALGSISTWMSNLIISMVFPIEQQAWGAFAFLPCSVACFLLGILLYFYLPETRGKNVSDIALLVSKGFKSQVR